MTEPFYPATRPRPALPHEPHTDTEVTMPTMPGARIVKCECGQVVARVHGQTIRPLADISIRRGHISVICPACGKRTYLSRALTDAA